MTLDQLEEQKLLLEFRERLADCNVADVDDKYLTKWLKARDFNLEKAEKMFRKSLEWRRTNDVDNIVNSYRIPAVLHKYYSIGLWGYDKFGSPVFFSQQGRLDNRGLLQSVTKKELVRFFIYLMEKNGASMGLNRELCKGETITIVVDMEGFSMRQMTFGPVGEVRNELIQIYEGNYPETLRKVFVINAPTLFSVIYSMIKPFLNQVTLDKIKIFGSNKKEWTSALLEDIEPNQVPAFYGGTMTDSDGDPKCPSKFNMGGEVPMECYLSNSPPTPKDGMKKMTVSSGKKETLEFQAPSTNAILRWEFMTLGGDIGFHIYCQSTEGKIDLVPLSRVESHRSMEEGWISCNHPGKYVIEFDNTFSYLTAKTVHYKITIDETSETVES